jgi:hypothetical protein
MTAIPTISWQAAKCVSMKVVRKKQTTRYNSQTNLGGWFRMVLFFW